MGIVNCEIVVVGGGILGLAIAALASQRGYLVYLLRLSDAEKPSSETLRNQGWLRSGLLDIKRSGADRHRSRHLARQMSAAGRRLLVDLGLPLPGDSEHGVVRLRDENEARLLEEDAHFLRMSGVDRLDPIFMKKRLGDIYEDGIFYSIPDSPFPEATVLTKLRDIAAAQGAQILQTSKPAHLVIDNKSESGVRVDFQLGSERQILSKATICAAGAGNLPLLEGLEIDSEMMLRQTPLFVLHDTSLTDVPIYADLARGFSFVRHPPEGSALPNGALVIGTRVHQDNVPFVPYNERKIREEDRKQFVACLPPILQDRILNGSFTAGVEVIPAKKLGLQHIEPWVDWVEGVPALLKVTPGRATMGMLVAHQVLTELEQRIGPPEKRRYARSRSRSTWDDEIFMHYHLKYDFDDSE